MWWTTNVARAVECAAPVTAERWRAELAEAERGYRELDATGFEDALDGAALDLPCVVDPLPPVDIARWHGLLLLRQYTDGRQAEAARSLAAARAAVPGWTVPADLLPAGHELRALAPAPESPTVPVPTPLDAATWFDGRPSAARPTERATVLQVRRTADGRVTTTAWLLPSDPLPGWPVAPPPPVPAPPVPAPAPVVAAPLPAPAPTQVSTPSEARRRPSAAAIGALVLTGLGAAAGGGLAAGASAAEATFWSDSPERLGWDGDRLAAQAKTVGSLTTASLGCFGLAAGAGVVALVTW